MENITAIIAQRLKLALTRANMKPIELSQITGISKSQISNYMSGRYAPKQDGIYLIAQALKVSPNWLMGIENPNKIINVYSSVHAGILSEMIEDIVDTEEITEDMISSDKDYFGIKVKGDSMYPEYIDGDTLIIEKTSFCTSGDDCIVAINGDEAFLKRVYVNDNSITLQALNPKYEPLLYTKEDIDKLPVKIIGKVVELRRKK